MLNNSKWERYLKREHSDFYIALMRQLVVCRQQHIFVSDKGTETIQYTADKKVESHICKDKKGKETGFYHKFRDGKVYEKEELLPDRTRRVITYYDNGKVESDYRYKGGTLQYKHGRCINYNEDGSVAKEEVYNKGKLQK